MKGRPRDPKRERRRTGHRRKPDEAPIVHSLPAPIASPLPEAPAHLSDEAKDLWANVADVIASGGIPVKNLDAYGIELMVTQLLRARQAGALVDKYGLMLRTAGGNVTASAFLRAERDATAMFLRLGEHYGLTVAARMRLGLMQLAAQSLTDALAQDLEGP